MTIFWSSELFVIKPVVLGETFHTMWQLTAMLKSFGPSHAIAMTGFHTDLKSSLLAWHSDFRKLVVSM